MMVYRLHVDGACKGNPGPGGWGVVLEGWFDVEGLRRTSVDASKFAPVEYEETSGYEAETTNQRMEIRAAIEGLRWTSEGEDVEVRIITDSQYVVSTMHPASRWKRRANKDLWAQLDAEVALRRVTFEWVRGHADDPLNRRADELARKAAEGGGE